MNIRDLRYIVAFADVGHFRRAAERCFVSQPTLSSQVRKVEEELGVVLFERSNKWVRLTPIGEQVVEKAREALRIVGEIEEVAQDFRDPNVGSLRVGIIPTIGPYLIPLVIEALQEELPQLQIIFFEEITEMLLQRLRGGEIDAAFVATASEEPGLVEVPLYEEPFLLAVPGTHALADRAVVPLEAIDMDEVLLLTDGHCFRDQVLDACNASSSLRSINMRATSLETVLALVAAGEGVTLVPALARARGAIDERIALCQIDSERARRAVRLLYRAPFPRKIAIERLAETVRSCMPATVRPIG